MPTSAVILASMCLFAAGLLDTVFKHYSMQARSRGVLIAGVGVVWLTCQVMYMAVTGAPPVLSAPTLMYGIAAAVFVTLSNILLLECLGVLPVSLASTVYRLNTIPLVVLAFVFLNESMGVYKLLGIAAGLVSVLVLYQSDDHIERNSRRVILFTVAIIAASCIRALYGFTTKLGILEGADVNSMLLLGASGWIVGGYIYARYRERQLVITTDRLKYIFVAGALVFAVVWLLTKALQLGDASLVIPLANMGFVAAFGLSVILKIESLNLRKLLAIAAAIAAVIFLSAAD